MLSINDLKVGTTFKYQGQPYQIVKASHLKMGRGAAVLQAKFKNLLNGNTLEKNFKQSDKLEEAEVEKRSADYLYREKDECYFMDENYEQFFVNADVIQDKLKFIKDSSPVNVLFFEDRAVGIELPPKVDLKVTEAPPAVRGDTAQGSVTKLIKLETGHELQAPIFIKQEDIVRVSTESGEYVERVNK